MEQSSTDYSNCNCNCVTRPLHCVSKYVTLFTLATPLFCNGFRQYLAEILPEETGTTAKSEKPGSKRPRHTRTTHWWKCRCH